MPKSRRKKSDALDRELARGLRREARAILREHKARPPRLAERIGRGAANRLFGQIGARRFRIIEAAWQKRRIVGLEKIHRRQQRRADAAIAAARLTPQESARYRDRKVGGRYQAGRVEMSTFKDKGGHRRWFVRVNGETVRTGLSKTAAERLSKARRRTEADRSLRRELDMTQREVRQLRKAIAQAAQADFRTARGRLHRELAQAETKEDRRRIRRQLRRISEARSKRGAAYAVGILARILAGRKS